MFLIRLVESFFWIYTILLFVRILGSWFPEYRNTKFMLFVAFYTDPYLNLFRSFIPPIGMFDISPIFAFLALGFIEFFIKSIILFFIR